MSWNYRVVRRKTHQPDEFYYAICEVYYDTDRKPTGYIKETAIASDTHEGLVDGYAYANVALSRPVIDGETLEDLPLGKPISLSDHAFCHVCGGKYELPLMWPRMCKSCRSVKYQNPTPVGVLLLPVRLTTPTEEGQEHGLVVGVRGGAPGLGKLGLPGGFVENNETLEEAAVRELFEETGIVVSVSDVKLIDTKNNSTGSQLLGFSLYTGPELTEEFVRSTFVACYECPQLEVIERAVELAFQTHTDAVARWFSKN